MLANKQQTRRKNNIKMICWGIAQAINSKKIGTSQWYPYSHLIGKDPPIPCTISSHKYNAMSTAVSRERNHSEPTPFPASFLTSSPYQSTLIAIWDHTSTTALFLSTGEVILHYLSSSIVQTLRLRRRSRPHHHCRNQKPWCSFFLHLDVNVWRRRETNWSMV